MQPPRPLASLARGGLAVAPFAVVTLLGGAGVITMVMKKNKKEDE